MGLTQRCTLASISKPRRVGEGTRRGSLCSLGCSAVVGGTRFNASIEKAFLGTKRSLPTNLKASFPQQVRQRGLGEPWVGSRAVSLRNIRRRDRVDKRALVSDLHNLRISDAAAPV